MYGQCKEPTLNFFLGFVTSNSDICRSGHIAFRPPGNCTMAPNVSTDLILAFVTIPGLTSECVKTGPSKALSCSTKTPKERKS